MKFQESEYIENPEGIGSEAFSFVVNVTIQYIEKTTHTFVVVDVFCRNDP